MRIRICQTNTNSNYEKELLKIGNGTCVQNENEEIELNEAMCNRSENLAKLIETIFPNIESNYNDHRWISERSILTLRYESVDEINDHILQKIPGDMKTYCSIDTPIDENESTTYPTEFLNSLRHTGIPDHKLQLKVGALIMLMRNLNPPLLCNGTKLIIGALNKYTIEGTILSGEGNLYWNFI